MTFKVTQYDRSGGIELPSSVGEFVTEQEVITALEGRSGTSRLEIRCRNTGRMWDFLSFKEFVKGKSGLRAGTLALT